MQIKYWLYIESSLLIWLNADVDGALDPWSCFDCRSRQNCCQLLPPGLMHPDHLFLQHRTHAQCGRFSPPISLCSHSNRAGRSLGLELSRQNIPQSCTWGIVKAWHQQTGKFFNPLLPSSSYFNLFALFYLFYSANIYLHLQQPIYLYDLVTLCASFKTSNKYGQLWRLYNQQLDVAYSNFWLSEHDKAEFRYSLVVTMHAAFINRQLNTNKLKNLAILCCELTA